MAINKTPQHEGKTAGKTAADTAEATGKAAKDMAQRTTRATGDNVEHASKSAADAAERSANAAAGIGASMANTAAQNFDPEAIVSSTRESLAVATKTQQQWMDTIERTSTSMLTGVTDLQREIAGFVSERIRQDLETQQELLGCRTLDDVREVQNRFFRTAMDQYSSQATKLMQLSAQVFAHSAETEGH